MRSLVLLAELLCGWVCGSLFWMCRHINRVYRWWKGLGASSDEGDGASQSSHHDESGEEASLGSDGPDGSGSDNERSDEEVSVASNDSQQAQLSMAALLTPGGHRRARGFSFDAHSQVSGGSVGGGAAAVLSGGGDAVLGSSFASSLSGTSPAGRSGGGFIGVGSVASRHGHHSPGVHARARQESVGSEYSVASSVGAGMLVRGRRVRLDSTVSEFAGSSEDEEEEASEKRRRRRGPSVDHTGSPVVATMSMLPPVVRRERQGSTDSAAFVDGWHDDDI